MPPDCGPSCRSGRIGRRNNNISIEMRRLFALGAISIALLLSSVFSGRAAAQTKSSFSASSGHEMIRLRDTLKTDAQRKQFRQALEMAPTTFVYDSYDADGRSFARCNKLRFNDSMKRLLQQEFVQKDAALHKQMRRLHRLTRPFNVSGDLAVRYRQLPGGAIALQYEISNLYIWGHRASDRLIRELLKANGVAQ